MCVCVGFSHFVHLFTESLRSHVHCDWCTKKLRKIFGTQEMWRQETMGFKSAAAAVDDFVACIFVCSCDGECVAFDHKILKVCEVNLVLYRFVGGNVSRWRRRRRKYQKVKNECEKMTRRVRSRAGDRMKFIMQVHNPIKTRLPYNQVEGFSSGCVQRRRCRRRRRHTDSSIDERWLHSTLTHTHTRPHEDKDVLLLLLLFSNGECGKWLSVGALSSFLQPNIAHASKQCKAVKRTIVQCRINYTIEATVQRVVALPKTYIIAFVDFCIN